MDPSTITTQEQTAPQQQNLPSGPDLWAQGYDGSQERGFMDNLGAHFIDFIQTFVVFAAIFALLYLFVSQPHKVSGNSMFPTFHNADYILTDKLSYKFHSPNKGDVIVFKNPRNEAEDFIKRVLALPGDTIKVEDQKVYVNGVVLDEYYLPPDTPTHPGSYLKEGMEITVEENTLIAIGDNRDHSSDSREWGPLPNKEIIGRVFFRYWPLQSFGFFKALP